MFLLWKSLLTSKGDTNRAAKRVTCATVLNKTTGIRYKNAGYTHVGRYLTGSVGTEHTPKYLTSTEVKTLKMQDYRYSRYISGWRI